MTLFLVVFYAVSVSNNFLNCDVGKDQIIGQQDGRQLVLAAGRLLGSRSTGKAGEPGDVAGGRSSPLGLLL